MDTNPKVSIIVPAFNAVKFIGDAIQSVLFQTWQNWELIVINDGSADETEAVIQPYLFDSRIMYRKQENAGCSAAKNTGLRLATGRFIQYLDADDILSPDKIAEQVDVLIRHPWSVAVCRTVAFTNDIDEIDTHEIDTAFLYNTNKPLDFVLNLYGINGPGGMIQPNAFLISRELSNAVGFWDTSISPSPDEDGEYFCRVMLAASSIHFTGSGINYYRKNPGADSLSKKISRVHAKGALRSVDLKTAHLLKIEDSDRVKRVMARHYAEIMYAYSGIYPELAAEAEEKINQLGFTKIPLTGGKNFQRMAKLVGFKRALRFKHLVK